MDKKQEMELLRDMYANSLKDKAESLRKTADYIVKTIEACEYDRINELGEVQSMGSDIDVLCAKMALMNRLSK